MVIKRKSCWMENQPQRSSEPLGLRLRRPTLQVEWSGLASRPPPGCKVCAVVFWKKMSLKETLKEEAGRRGLDLVEGRLNGVCVCVKGQGEA